MSSENTDTDPDREHHPQIRHIGIIVDRPKGPPHLIGLIESLRNSGVAEVTVLLANASAMTDTRRTSWFFRWVLAAETIVLGLFLKHVGETRRRIGLESAPLENAKDGHFDLLINATPATIAASNLPAAKDGIASIHYGDLTRGVEGPPGFWESRFGRGASGIFLLRDGKCLFSGRYKSKRTHAMNVQSVYLEGFVDLATVMNRYAATGKFEEVPLARTPSWRAPGAIDVGKYRIRTVLREAEIFLRERLRGQKQIFSVGFVRSDWESADLEAASLLDNPVGGYYADPFLIERDGRTICFVEDFSHRLNRGRIAAIDVSEPVPKSLGLVIEENHHMSFPYVFEYEGHLYMTPESSETGEICLYHCSDFPMKWGFGSLMDGVEAADTMIFEHQERWWMLTNLRPEGCADFYSRLYAFHADSPISTNWNPHDLNPILIDAEGGRNGGLLRDSDGALHRVGQNQGMTVYGESFSLFRIDELTPTTYQESLVRTVQSDLFDDQIGGHHMHAADTCTVFDLIKWESV